MLPSADINPIGSIDKADLKRFISWAQKNFDLPCLHDFLTAVPTAELVWPRRLLNMTRNVEADSQLQEPITQNYVQSDEAGEF